MVTNITDVELVSIVWVDAVVAIWLGLGYQLGRIISIMLSLHLDLFAIL